ncbi:MAG: IS256 family transposase [Gemmatimonadetes bacterium]|jgi:putative transposase|nr:IS256 family transposase [Gemmatimonadota bacterium]
MTQGPEDTAIRAALESLIENGLDGMGDALCILMNEAMKIERSEFLQAAPYQRSPDRVGHANGFKDKTVDTRVGALHLQVPQVRGLPADLLGFYPQSLEKGLRSERALKLAIAEMYVTGVSTRKVAQITQQLCGVDVSSAQVSRAAALLDEELESWRQRPLGEIPYLVLDARYEKVRHGGHVVDVALLLAIGVQADGKRSVLGVSVSLSEAEVHWRTFLTSLLERGLHGVRFLVSDDHAGLKQARQASLPSVPWQRCQFHLQQNAQGYVPKQAMRKEVAQAIRDVFNAPDKTEAERMLQLLVERYQKSAPALAEWAEENIPEGLTVFQLPKAHRLRMRTTNGLERLNREIKRRTRVASLFPNEASLLRLASALLVEIDDEWMTGKIYLNMKTE